MIDHLTNRLERRIIKSYLHDLVRAFLIYETETAKNMIFNMHPEWRLFQESKIIKARRPEVGFARSGYFDCLWCLESNTNNRTGFAIFFEVKTGRYDRYWVEQFFRAYKTVDETKQICKIFSGNNYSEIPAYIIYIAQKEEGEKLIKEIEKEWGRGRTLTYVRLIPLEYFIPVIMERIGYLEEEVKRYEMNYETYGKYKNDRGMKNLNRYKHKI